MFVRQWRMDYTCWKANSAGRFGLDSNYSVDVARKFLNLAGLLRSDHFNWLGIGDFFIMRLVLLNHISQAFVSGFSDRRPEFMSGQSMLFLQWIK